MDKTIFEVEISNSGPKSYETATVMKMPASFAEFSDALQKARIKDGSFCKNELTCIHYNGLTHAMIGWNANLYDLNLFAQRLASLTEEQKKGMDALLKIKQNHRVAPIPLNQLINLTYNTDICCFAPRVSNHEELGAFLYANEMLSNEAMALLDTTEEGSGFRERLLELLGEQHQEDHGGVFTDFGYAELGGEIKDIYVCQSNETACFHRSDAPVVLEVRKGFFNDPSYDNDKTAVLNLPAADAGIWRAVEKVDAASVDECAFRCVDCLIPFLRDAINNAIDDEDGIEQADEFAKRLAQIEREWPESDMVKYKALLSVVDHPSLQDATRLMGEIDQYELRPEVAQTWGYSQIASLQSEYKDWDEDLKAWNGLEAQPAEEHPQFAVAGLVCRRIGARCKEVQPDRAVYQFPGLLLRYRNDLHWGRFDQAMERMETMAALALSVVLRECKQMGIALTTEQGVRFLESHILPHQNRSILKNRADEIAMQFQSVLAKNNRQGIRTQAEKKEVASAWLELAISCAKVPVKYEADEIKRRQKEEKTQREAEPVMA